MELEYFVIKINVNFKKFVKCGFAGQNFPEYIFPSLVGRPILRSGVKVGNTEIKVIFLINFI